MMKFEFLTKDEGEISLINRYWAKDEKGLFKEKVADLALSASHKNVISFLHYINSIYTAWDMNQSCASCGAYLQIYSRSHSKNHFQVTREDCYSCRQKAYERAQKEEEELIAILKEREKVNRKVTIDYNSLADDAAMVLLALKRAMNKGQLPETFKIRDCRGITHHGCYDIIMILKENSAITDEPLKSGIKAYYLEGGELHYHENQVFYSIVPNDNVNLTEDAISTLEKRIYKNNVLMKELWLTYALSECLFYLNRDCDSYRLSPNEVTLEEVIAVLYTALQKYSISQMWFVIWIVVKEAASLSTKEFYNREKAVKTIPGKIHKLLKKVVKESRDLRFWDRRENQPTKTLGEVFYDLFCIDEDTTGEEVLKVFINQNLRAQTYPSISEFAELSKNIFTISAENAIASEVMFSFAKKIREGMEVGNAMNSLLVDFAVLNHLSKA